MYKALLEKYGKEIEQILYNRKKKYIDIICNGFMCKRHKCKLSKCDDYDGYYWRYECYDYKHFLYRFGKRYIESVFVDFMYLEKK